jgi:hypothetical protein
MAQIRFSFSQFPLALALKLTLLTGCFLLLQVPQVVLAQGIPRRWQARQYKPPIGIGAPARTEGGGTRSGNSYCSGAGKRLTALIPNSQFGVTVAAYPKFFVYMPALSPQASPPAAEFRLEDKGGNAVYKSIFKTIGKSGIVTLSLPAQGGVSPLKIGQDYKWSFSIICQPDERSQDITVEGWVRRIPLNPTLNNQLKQALPQQQVELYAEGEIWQDALATLVQLRRDYPNNAAIKANWEKLLSAAGLNNLTQESFVTIPTTPGSQFTSSQS